MSLEAISAANQARLNQESPLFSQLKVGTVLGQVVDGVLGVAEATAAAETAASAANTATAAVLAAATSLAVKPGVTAGGTIPLADEDPSNVIAILAVTTATGAFATKALLAVTTDFTVHPTTKVMTCVTDQSAATLLIFYLK